jgi:hypothetical protein
MSNKNENTPQGSIKESIQSKLEKNIFAMYLFMALAVSLAGIV